jgi:hypothetical protein
MQGRRCAASERGVILTRFPVDDDDKQILRDMWNGMKALHTRIDSVEENLRSEIQQQSLEIRETRGRIEQVRNDLGTRIDNVRGDLGKRIDDVRGELGKRIDNVRDDLGARIDSVSLEVRALRTATQGGFDVLMRADARRERDIAELRERLERLEDPDPRAPR